MFKTKTTMKKTYINPSIDVYELKATQQLLAGSVEGFNDELDTTGGNGSVALSRDFDFDDEEDW